MKRKREKLTINPKRGIAIFVCKYTCKQLFRRFVNRTGDHLKLFKHCL